jgi:hypothetical protein
LQRRQWNYQKHFCKLTFFYKSNFVLSLLIELENYVNIITDAAREAEASKQVSSSNSYWALKGRFYFRFFGQNALLLTDQNALLLTGQNALHA